MLEVCDLLFDSDFGGDCMNLRRDFEFIDTVETVIDYGDFEVGLNTFCIMILLQVYGYQGVECGSLNVIGLHNPKGSGTLEGVALLK